MKLDEFRLESYDERDALVVALVYYQAKRPDIQPEAVEALLKRLTDTECQPGGCSICNPDYNMEHDYD
jgi:hypothetical protein